jgi:hypothetical protein
MQPNFTSQRPKQTQTGPTDRRRYRGEHRQERERELQRERESLQVALRKHSKRRAAFFCEGREGEEDKREKEIAIAKKIYLNFKGLK